MKPVELVNEILQGKTYQPQKECVHCFAPANVALAKYWGKRDKQLNLPVNSSLSISLGDRGSMVELSILDASCDEVLLFDESMPADHPFAKRVIQFLDLFRGPANYHFKVNAQSNIPIAAGLASSASGFAVLTLALNELFGWQLDHQSLSILARLGSGSASRSIEPGFVWWHAGSRPDGMDSYAEKLTVEWPEMRVGLLVLDDREKPMSSRVAMQATVETSPLYHSWPQIAETSLVELERALKHRDIDLLGQTAEKNALAMHACMLVAEPPILYSQPATISAMKLIWKARREGLSVYFTQDAGPNLKLLFLEKDTAAVQALFPGMDVVEPFSACVEVAG
ncbi:MAG: diphosphomevalonate decarboxylase [Legionellaceae bacterium]|nr:diphosphomevalonate decarboxylase [Legionellaceae bacterium]